MQKISLLDRARRSNAAVLLSSVLVMTSALGGTGAANAQEKVEIEWATWGWAEPVFQEVAQKYVQMFEAEHPNIKIKQGGVPYPRYEETMLTRLEGGAAPDMTRAADAMYFLFKDRGYLAPLDDYFDIGKYKDDLVDAQQIVVDDGKSYGLIEGFYPYALIYNKGLLADAGITEPPKSPQEFLDAAKKLTKGQEQYGYGTRHTMAEQSGWWYEMSFWITAFNAVWAKDGKPTVNTPEMIEAVSFFKEMYDADIFPKGVDAATYRRMFAEGKIAMQTDNQGMYEFVKQASPDIELGFAPPPFAPNPIQTIVEVVMMTIPKESPNPEAAATFLEWWFNRMAEYGKEIKSLVGSKSANAALVAELPHLKVYAETPVALNGGVLPQGFETRVPEFRQIVLERISQVRLENRDPKEAMDEAQRELENLPQPDKQRKRHWTSTRLSFQDGFVVAQSRWLPYLLLAPIIPVLALLIIYPILSAIVVSLYRTKYLVPRPQDFAGLANYVTLLSDPKFVNSLWVTSIYVVAFTAVTLGFGMLFALLLDQRFPGRGIVRALITVPWATPMIASILVWTWMFDYQYGVINYLLVHLGLSEPILWLSDPTWALPAVIAVDAWRIFPFAVIVILTALQAVDSTLYEAAKMDGAGPMGLFRHVTLPGIRGTLGILALLLVIWSLRRFETAWILTQGGPSGRTDLLVVNVYREAFRYHRPGYAAAMAVVGLAISLLIAAIYFIRERRRDAV